MVTIRKAIESDIDFLYSSLLEICAFHSAGRPDIFVSGKSKYTKEELKRLICSENRFVSVADEGGTLYGYIFMELQTISGKVSVPRKSLYVDDLYVCPEFRSIGAGAMLMNHAFALAAELGCYNLTLNVWDFPGNAMNFYTKLGLKPMSHKMEKIL